MVSVGIRWFEVVPHFSKYACYNVKPLAYYFYVKTKILVDFSINISVP